MNKVNVLGLLLLLSIAMITSVCLPLAYSDENTVPNVFIFTLNGVRNSESIDDALHQYMPNIFNTMLHEGVIYDNLCDENLEIHFPTGLAIISGEIQQRQYFSSQKPTIFQYALKKYGWPRTKTWAMKVSPTYNYVKTEDFNEDTFPCTVLEFRSTDSDEVWSALGEPEKQFLQMYRNSKVLSVVNYPNWENLTEAQFHILKQVIETYMPKLVYCSMVEPEVAHYGTYARYVLSLRQADERLHELWQLLNSHPYYKDNTYIFITPDHGRDRYHMQHYEHSLGDPERTWLYVSGPDIKKGVSIHRKVQHVDIFTTIAQIMKLEAHVSDGRVLADSFESSD